MTWVLAHAARNRITSDTPVNVATGANISLLEVIAELERLVGHPLAVEPRPPRAGDMRASQADPTRFLKIFPDAPGTPFSRALEETMHENWVL